MDAQHTGTAHFWDNFLRAAETEPHAEVNVIQGASGIAHHVTAVGVDANRRRLVVISPEREARLAALIQSDIQSAFRSIQVMLVRPVKVCEETTAASQREARSEIGAEALSADNGSANKSEDGDESGDGEDAGEVDATKRDRQLGLCAVPLDCFTPAELSLFQDDGADFGEAQDVLRRRQILQFFFPAPDHLALALIDRNEVRGIPQLIDHLVKTPDLGHPFGPTEIMPAQHSFTDLINELRRRNLVADSAQGFAITEEGRAVRRGVERTPREALVSKILNRLSANLNFKSSWLSILRRQRV